MADPALVKAVAGPLLAMTLAIVRFCGVIRISSPPGETLQGAAADAPRSIADHAAAGKRQRAGGAIETDKEPVKLSVLKVLAVVTAVCHRKS